MSASRDVQSTTVDSLLAISALTAALPAPSLPDSATLAKEIEELARQFQGKPQDAKRIALDLCHKVKLLAQVTNPSEINPTDDAILSSVKEINRQLKELQQQIILIKPAPESFFAGQEIAQARFEEKKDSFVKALSTICSNLEALFMQAELVSTRTRLYLDDLSRARGSILDTVRDISRELGVTVDNTPIGKLQERLDKEQKAVSDRDYVEVDSNDYSAGFSLVDLKRLTENIGYLWTLVKSLQIPQKLSQASLAVTGSPPTQSSIPRSDSWTTLDGEDRSS